MAGAAVGGVGLVAAGAAGLAGQTAAVAADGPDAAAGEAAPGHGPGPREALRLLMEGNRRWACGQPEHPHQTVAWRHHVASHQDPFATVVSCIDSRVPPEIVFDRGIGDLFAVRTGAQTLDSRVVLGSIEFGPNGYPSARLMFVLGHQNCGAVSAAIAAIQTGERAPGHIQAVVNALRPAYRAAIGQPGDLLDNMIRAQVKLTVGRLKNDPLLAELIGQEGLLIVGGRYDLTSGLVEIIA
ncbi:MAG TPA: carbonic anhydrase [Streptosporangiaceae bacterium]|nr:carbonic anhydrase [Streptosporangiaceae bacterium]